MATLILLALLAQQYPPDGEPITPPTSVLWVDQVADVFAPADVTQRIDVLYVIASAVTTNQATADSKCAAILAKGNETLAHDPANISRLNQVGCKIITYSGQGIANDLQAIAGSTGVLHPQANQWRNDLGADLVQMVSNSGDLAGQGFQCPFNAEFGYSVVNDGASVSNLSSIHEMGHNVCLAHDLPNQTPSYPYGSGFCPGAQDPTRRDPMVYPSPCGGSRVSYFGNPNISPFGYPFGNASNADNARVWREQAARVADFRPQVTPPTCSTITISPSTVGNGYTGRAYSQAFTATGGTGPYTFTVSAGALPTGITLSTATISGTPTTAATSTFTLKATDASVNQCTGTTTYSLTVLQLPTAPTNLIQFTPPQ